MRVTPHVERLEAAGLVLAAFYDDDENRVAKTLLLPDEADALADELRAAAKEVREA